MRGISAAEFHPDIPATHLSNPPATFHLGHTSFAKFIILDGPGGKLSFYGSALLEGSPTNLEMLPLANVREVRLSYRKRIIPTTLEPPVFYPSHFPALETLIVNCDADVLDTLLFLLSNPSSCPSLNTIGSLNCDLSVDFMEEFTEFASRRQKILTSIWLHRFQIVHDGGVLPGVVSIRRLRDYVKIVEARTEDKLSTDLV